MADLQTTTEHVDKDRVKLHVTVPEAALGPAIDAVYRRWANQIKVPGFRKGKVPRQLIDARVGGPDIIREEAVRDALPDLYRAALRAEELEPIAPPDIEVQDLVAGEPLVFEATVDIRPEIELPNFEEIQVEAPSAEVSDDDLDEQLNRLRDRFAELETASRAARRGDFVLIDLKAMHHDQPVDSLTVDDYLYEIGSFTGPPKLDEELEGNKAGAILKFSASVPPAALGDKAPEGATEVDLSFTVLLKEVKSKKLPPLDDDFAKTVGEFDTLDALKEDLRTRLAGVKQQMNEEEVRGRVLDELVAASDLEAPEKLLENEFEHRLGHLEEDLQRAGLKLEDYAQQMQVTELEIRRDMRLDAARAVKAELLLEEVARREKIDVTEEEIGTQIALAAAQSNRDPKEVAKQVVESGRVSAIAADIMRRKALDYVVGAVKVTGRDNADVPGETDEEG